MGRFISKVWKYFLREGKGGHIARCKKCGKTLAAKGGTSHLNRHILIHCKRKSARFTSAEVSSTGKGKNSSEDHESTPEKTDNPKPTSPGRVDSLSCLSEALDGDCSIQSPTLKGVATPDLPASLNSQEKEPLEKHNSWPDEEIKTKSNTLAEMFKSNMDSESKMSARIADLERKLGESSESLKRKIERVTELERRVSYLEKELSTSNEAAAINEQLLTNELATVSKLVELYKESQTHLTQVEDEYKEKLEKEVSMRIKLEKEAAEMREQLEKREMEIENVRKSSELSLLPMTSPQLDSTMQELVLSDGAIHRADGDVQMIVPKAPSISGTALAASLLREGWSLAKMYEQYQNAADALRHERWGRRHAEAVLERVLHEIEQKAELILDERAKHERLVEAYSLLNQKLEQSLLEHENFENTIRSLKSELKRRDCDNIVAQKEINDPTKQASVLLKECQDIQIRRGGTALSASLMGVEDNIHVSDRSGQRTFRDINGLVEQNVELQSQVQRLSAELEKVDEELKERYQNELQKRTDEMASKMDAVCKRSEEQQCLIDSLHTSYKEIAQTNEAALKQIESVHEEYKAESEKSKLSLESEVTSLRSKLSELENIYNLNCQEAASAIEEKDKQLFSLGLEISVLKDEITEKMAQMETLQTHVSFLKDELDRVAMNKCKEECEAKFNALKKKYINMCLERKYLYNELIELRGNIRVFCRCRPLNSDEITKGYSNVINIDPLVETEIKLICRDGSMKQYKFDHVFGPAANQEAVFAETLPTVMSALDGYNVCIFAYGQTGTGKTFTMEGTPENRGVNYRALELLFNTSATRSADVSYEFTFSMLEVYNERIRDLLSESAEVAKKLEIRQSADGTYEVPGLVESEVSTVDEVWSILRTGGKNRSVGSTSANELSSRSHCLVRVTIRSKNLVSGQRSRSHMWLVDLAGSERDVEGERLRESQFINKSLSALGDVISALASKNSHIPYRNSNLTHLLQSSLGGDCKTLMFVQISPSSSDLGVTTSSLTFATRVRGIHSC